MYGDQTALSWKSTPSTRLNLTPLWFKMNATSRTNVSTFLPDILVFCHVYSTCSQPLQGMELSREGVLLQQYGILKFRVNKLCTNYAGKAFG